MDFITGGIICIGLLLGLMGAGIQIGLAFILSGFLVSTLLLGFSSSLSLVGQVAYFSIASPTWACIPLFILMGSFAAGGGFARRAYNGVNALSFGTPGSLGVATCFSCAVFGAISGSSIATTAIFGKMALPEMNRLRYNQTFSVGCIASAGTFASMIPPSMMMIIYALFTQQSVGKLFAAGVIPGIITAAAYSFYIIYRAKTNPALAPAPDIKDPSYSGMNRWKEAVSLATLLFGFLLGSFRRMGMIIHAMKESANTTAMLFLINVGALFYSRVLAVTQLPTELTMMLQGLDIPRIFILFGILLIMFFLGMIMVPVGIYALTLPIVLPILINLNYDPIWFGVIALKLTEIGAITPPVGLNVYAMKGVIPREMNISLEDIFRGIWPFCMCDIIILVVLIMFPILSTWLPDLLLG
jgi:TRAP-type C4-dicarboxylate transport system permease large subunit